MFNLLSSSGFHCNGHQIIRNYSKTFTISENSLIYNFVMEKSWQSSNSSRLIRNVRRSVHQVFFLKKIFVLKFLKTGLSVERCGGVWTKRITQSSSLSIITTSICCFAFCCRYHSYFQVFNRLLSTISYRCISEKNYSSPGRFIGLDGQTLTDYVTVTGSRGHGHGRSFSLCPCPPTENES